MVRLVRCAAALTAMLVAVPAAAKHSRPAPPPPAHNFVNIDLTASVPPAPPPPGSFRYSVVLLDAASVGRKDDTVTFDTLSISRSFGRYMSGDREVGPPQGAIVFNTERYQASCGWRTLHSVPLPAAPYQAGERYQAFAYQPVFLQDSFPAPLNQYAAAIDKVCEGRPLDAARGYESVAAAVAAWTVSFSVLAPPPPRYMPDLQTLEDDSTSHQFRAIATDSASGNELFLDTGSIARDGQMATALSLALLGPDAQRVGSENAGVAMLRNVRYDCLARTMTVIAQQRWDRSERSAGQTQIASAPRSAGEAPVIKSEIDAACGTAPPPDGPTYSSVLAAWHAMRDAWPPSPMDAWLPCLWSHVPEESRNAYVTQWTGASDEKFFQVQQADVQPLMTACAIRPTYADLALDKLRFYAGERAALQKLSARKLDEATILAAWRGLGWTERLRLIHDLHSFGTDIQEQLAFQDKFATSLGLPSGDADGRKWLNKYVWSQAWIEGA